MAILQAVMDRAVMISEAIHPAEPISEDIHRAVMTLEAIPQEVPISVAIHQAVMDQELMILEVIHQAELTSEDIRQVQVVMISVAIHQAAPEDSVDTHQVDMTSAVTQAAVAAEDILRDGRHHPGVAMGQIHIKESTATA